jgi:transcriptional regulator with GAF, ATPase, and Fis domain
MYSGNMTKKRFVMLTLGFSSVVYAVCVFLHVSTSYELEGVHSVIQPRLIGLPASIIENGDDTDPSAIREVSKVGDLKITTWSDLLQAPNELHRKIINRQADDSWHRVGADHNDEVALEYQRADLASPTTHRIWCKLRQFPPEQMIPSFIWLFLKGALFVVGAVVYWKRPNDEAALRFYILCVITLGAYVGGYHWSLIATSPVLLVVFIICAVLLPVASLHFYLVFPRKKPWLERYPRRTLAAIYGIPLANLACLIGVYAYVRWSAEWAAEPRFYPKELIFLSFAIAMLWYVACLAALIHSLRTVEDPMERKQVKCILTAVVISYLLIGPSLYIVLAEPERFLEGAVTWPMFGASAIVTLAFAIGMTRYRLMELDKVITSGMGYFLVSFLAGLMYYAVVFIGALFFSHFVATTHLPAALTVSTSALLFVIVLDTARSRFQKVLDRRLSRNKSQLDQTLQQMSQAISQLVDPPVLAQRLLTTVADTLGIARGAVYLRQEKPGTLRLVANLGEAPSLPELTSDDALLEALQGGLGLRSPAAADDAGTKAQKQLRMLGGEVAQPLLSEGTLLAILILGPKDGPYRAQDWNLLSAFAQITIVALESAAQHRAIEQLNQDLQAKVDKIAEQQRRIMTLQTQLTRQTAAPPPDRKPADKPEPEGPLLPNLGGIVGSSPVVRQLLGVVRKVAPTDAVVLLRGESGTGKELLARAVHEASPRAAKPYVKVHCAALSASLLESELFGHVKGAFTGAHKDKVGRFELADGGTLFLDEIGDISLEVQTKLLRVLQEKTFERVGSSEPLKVDVRIVTATHQNLEELIRQGRFREDLFYRLNVFPIEVPPLRDRAEDVPELAMFFIAQSAQRCKRSVTQIDDDALALLKGFAWPGNIRQLENMIERAVVIAETDTLTLRDMPAELFGAHGSEEAGASPQPDRLVEPAPISAFRSERDRFEREQLEQAMTTASGNKAEAARILGIARSTLVSRLKKLGLEK